MEARLLLPNCLGGKEGAATVPYSSNVKTEIGRCVHLEITSSPSFISSELELAITSDL